MKHADCRYEFFDIVHNKNGHIGRDKCHEIISRQWYIRGLGRLLRDYLRHCPQCQLYQTQRHQPYGTLQPILTPPTPYHTISMDFILALPITLEGYDSVLTVTCKASRTEQEAKSAARDPARFEHSCSMNNKRWYWSRQYRSGH